MTNFALRKEQREKIWILEQEGKIRGSILAVWSSDEHAYIKCFFLHQDQHGKDFVRKLMKSAIDFVKSQGGKIVTISPEQAVIGESNIFDKFGFKKLEKSKTMSTKLRKISSQNH